MNKIKKINHYKNSKMNFSKKNNHYFILEKILKVANLASDALMQDFLILQKDKVFYKENNTEIVTQIDIDIHDLTIGFLKEFFPKAKFISEENSENHQNEQFEENKAELVFIVDPIDGTSNYIYGLDQFCFSLGVMSFGELIGGIVISPVTKEIFYGMKDCGAFYQKDETILPINDIYDNLITKNHKYLIGTTYPCINLIYDKLSKKISVRILGSVAMTICYALIGKFDGFVSNSAKIWDIAGAIGIASNIQGLNLFIKYNSEKDKYVIAIHRIPDQLEILKNILQ